MYTHTIFTGASFYQGGGAWVKTVAVDERGSIVAVDAEVSSAERVDFGGAYALPAFEDAHNHPVGRSRIWNELDFRNSKAVWSDAKESIAARVSQTASGEWIICNGWNTSSWGEVVRSELDALSSKHGILLVDISNHGGMVNTRGATTLYERGVVVVPSGRVREEQFENTMIVTAPDAHTYCEAIPRSQEKLLRLGICAVHDMHISLFQQLEALKELERSGSLVIPLYAYLSPVLLNDTKRLQEYVDSPGELVKIQGVKLFVDGAFGMRTASMRDPYADHGECGTLRTSLDDAKRIVARAVNLGLSQIALHCIGDRGIEQTVEIVRELGTEYKNDITAWRFEHFEMPSEKIIYELAEMGVVASMQPNFSWDVQNYGDRLKDRIGRINPFKTVLASGMKLIFGSDDMPSGPLEGLSWILGRTPFDSQHISLEDGIVAYTKTPAEVVGVGGKRGRLAKDFEASFVVLDRNPFELSADELARLEVRETWIKGRRVYPVCTVS